MYKLVSSALLLVLFSVIVNAQIVTGGKVQHALIDSNSIAVSNLMTDDASPPSIVVSSRLGIWAPSFKFEERINKSFSAGFNLGGRFIFFTGRNLEPFGRYYFKHTATKGLYVQLKGVLGVYHTKIRNGSWAQSITGANQPHGRGGGGRGVIELPSTLFETYGGGATVGYQFILGRKKHCALEVYGGFQYVYSSLDIGNKLIVQKLALQNPIDIGVKIGGAF